MNPFFIFLFFCAFVAIIFWFKTATAKQGISALKGILIAIAILITILVATGRLPIFTGIPLLLLVIFKKIALAKLLIPFIRLLAGNSKRVITPKLDRQQAIDALQLSSSPSREEIVKAHRKASREIQAQQSPNYSELAKLDTARELLILEIDSTEQDEN